MPILQTPSPNFFPYQQNIAYDMSFERIKICKCSTKQNYKTDPGFHLLFTQKDQNLKIFV
jgi:hypothetical protein